MTESTARTESAPSAMQASAYSSRGTARDQVSLPTDVFDGTINAPVMHQAVTAYLANQRQGNAATKIRKFVTGGNQKPWKQKGTGRARQGSIRAPNWVGGGKVFGPIPRSYAQYVPRQVRALAKRSALNARATAGAVRVIDAFQFERPQTRRIQSLLDALGVAGSNVLILTDGVKHNVVLSGRNIPSVQVLPFSDVSTYHVLWSDVVLIESAALGQALTPLVEAEPATPERPARNAPRPAAVAKPKSERTAKARASAKKKPAAKKAATKKAATKKRTPAKKKGRRK
jgi:large subunit ribosomal protein L4